MDKVVWSKSVQKQLDKLPMHLLEKFRYWVLAVEVDGIRKTRELPDFHDEPLRGDRKGERSVRLNKAYRGIYVEAHDGSISVIEVIEVTKHEY